MAAADISGFTDPGDLNFKIATLLAMLSGASGDDKPAFVDSNELVDALAFIAALVLEQSPGFTTPRHLRLASEEFGRRAHQFAKAIREQRERTGVPVMSAFAEDFRVIPKDAAGHA
jgi:hypothetical protein